VILAGVLGKDKVIAGTVTSAIGRRGAGDIQLERLRGMGLAAGHPLSQRIANALNQAGLKARLYAHADEMKWSKMLTNLLANASSAILDMTPSEIFAHSGLFRLEIRQLKEALRVMSVLRIHSVDLPGTPVRALAFAVRSLPLSISKPMLKQAVGGGRGGKMPSFHIDLYSGRGKSEVNYLNGAVVRYGEKFGVPTPVNRLLNSTLMALTHGDISLETYKSQPEKLLASLGD
jgi:2-dehydropantoate 2-reductase